jgi:hypothetical protein
MILIKTNAIVADAEPVLGRVDALELFSHRQRWFAQSDQPLA